MAGPIFLMFAGKMTEAWYRLSQEEQNEIFAKLDAAIAQVGGKGILGCDASWSGPWQFFGVEEYPDIEAVHKHAQLEGEVNWYRYADAVQILGTKME